MTIGGVGGHKYLKIDDVIWMIPNVTGQISNPKREHALICYANARKLYVYILLHTQNSVKFMFMYGSIFYMY